MGGISGRGGRGSVLSAGVGAYASGIGERMECRRRVLRRGVRTSSWSIIRNSFGYIAISVDLNRSASFCVIVEKWLKRNKSISGILCEGRSEIGERAEDREIGFFTIGRGCVGMAVRRFLYDHTIIFVKQTTQTPLNML